MKTDITGSTSSQFSNFYSHKAISGVPHYASSFLPNRPPKPGTTPAYFKLKETKQQKYLVKDTSFFRLFSRIKSRLKMNSHYIWKLLLDRVCDKERLPGTQPNSFTLTGKQCLLFCSQTNSINFHCGNYFLCLFLN